MQGLTFRTDQDFEEICCYLMRDWVARNMMMRRAINAPISVR